MSTFKEIAKAAGVSYGTVSNVFNNRCNVTAEKKKRVMQAAEELGYIPHQAARDLHLEKTNLLGIVIPNIYSAQYADFYSGFSEYAKQAGYRVKLCLHDNIDKKERALAVEIRSAKAAGIITVSCMKGRSNPYYDAGFAQNEVLFAEERPFKDTNYVGFDYRLIGSKIAAQIKQYHRIVYVAGFDQSYSSKEVIHGITANLDNANKLTILNDAGECDSSMERLAFKMISDRMEPDLVIVIGLNQAETMRNIFANFGGEKIPEVLSIIPSFMDKSAYYVFGETSASLMISGISGESGEQLRTTLLPVP